MPPLPAVKELLAARAQRGDDVLEVRRGSRNRTKGRGIERTPPHSEKRDRGNPARHLKAAAGDVLVRNAVCGQVQNRPEQKRARRRADCRADRGTGRNVQRNNHCSADRSFIRKGTRLPLRRGNDKISRPETPHGRDGTSSHSRRAGGGRNRFASGGQLRRPRLDRCAAWLVARRVLRWRTWRLSARGSDALAAHRCGWPASPRRSARADLASA
jgi:hypothetical protein